MAEEKDGEAKDHDVGGGVGHQCSGGGGGGGGGQEDSGVETDWQCCQISRRAD